MGVISCGAGNKYGHPHEETLSILRDAGVDVYRTDLLGTITGGMTSTPGLAAADSMTDSNIPSVAYATVYPIAMVFLILIIQVIASAVY